MIKEEQKSGSLTEAITTNINYIEQDKIKSGSLTEEIKSLFTMEALCSREISSIEVFIKQKIDQVHDIIEELTEEIKKGEFSEEGKNA